MPDPFREPVALSDPDPAWATAYARLAAELAPTIDGTLEHIGSTAVPLRAKPIIDIQLATGDRARAIAALERLGFTHHGEGGIPGRAYLTRRTPPAVNVHVFATGNPLLEANRAIRDHLRSHPGAARAYAAAKDAALAAGHDDLMTYSGAKAATIAEIKADALRSTCACRHATTRVPESRPQALELVSHQTALGDQLELVAADSAKWMAVHRCRRCGAYWGEDSMSSGHADLGFIFPIETDDPHRLARHRALVEPLTRYCDTPWPLSHAFTTSTPGGMSTAPAIRWC